MTRAVPLVDRVRLPVVAVLAGAALGLAGCSDDDGTAAATGTATATHEVTVVVPATPTAQASPTTGATADVAAFVAAVRADLPDVAAGRSDEEIGQLAEQACTGLAQQVPADEVVAQMRSLGTLDAEATDEATARELVKLAIDTVCLDQASRVDEF